MAAPPDGDIRAVQERLRSLNAMPDLDDEEGMPNENAAPQWNPNNLIANMSQLSVAEPEDPNLSAELERSVEAFVGLPANDPRAQLQLLEKMLDLEHPKITSPMIDFLLREGVVELLVNFITRLPANHPRKKLSAGNPLVAAAPPLPAGAPEGTQTEVPVPRRPRALEDPVAMKRSYHATTLLASTDEPVQRLIQLRQHTIVAHLFMIFDTDSQGNFQHFQAVLQHLLRLNPQMTAHILEYVAREGAIFHMLSYVHLPAVAASILLILRARIPSHNVHDRMLKSLINDGWTRTMGMKIYGEESHDPEAQEDIVRFLILSLEELAAAEDCVCVYEALVSNAHFVAGVINVIANKEKKYQRPQREQCAHLLNAFIMKFATPPLPPAGMPPHMADTSSPRFANLLALLQGHIATNLATLASVVMDSGMKGSEQRFSAYQVPVGLTTARLDIVRIISEVCIAQPARSLEALCTIPGLWTTLGNWFIDYPQNNMYHATFYKIFRVAVFEDHEATLRALLTKGKFLSRMIEHYTAPTPSGSRGWILLMTNMLRLHADVVDLESYGHKVLQGNDKWAAFLPRLREDTERQARVHFPIGAKGSVSFAHPHFAPNMDKALIKEGQELKKKAETAAAAITQIGGQGGLADDDNLPAASTTMARGRGRGRGNLMLDLGRGGAGRGRGRGEMGELTIQADKPAHTYVDDGIELGSQYARSLGFRELARVVATPSSNKSAHAPKDKESKDHKEQSKDQHSGGGAGAGAGAGGAEKPAAASPVTGGGDGEPTGAKKKKKKKKKKRKSAEGSSTTESTTEGDDDDGEDEEADN